METYQLEMKTREIRATCLQMAHDSGEGHLSSALSYVDVLVALYYTWMDISVSHPKKPDRDRFILSKGHGCAALYAVLADLGFIPKKNLFEYARSRSPLPNHPCIHALPLLDISSGSLGHGLGVATGLLYALRLRKSESRVVVLLGDGECNEGSVWEAAMFAAAQKLDNLLAVVDNNGIQAVGNNSEITGNTDLEKKFRAFGWGARTINGNNTSEICDALDSFPFENGKPSVIVAKTRSGVSFIGSDVLWHYRVPSKDELQLAIEEMGQCAIHME